MTLCYLGLGSNLRTPTRQLNQAIRLLKALPKTNIKKKSSIIRSQAAGVRGQPLYANAVVAVITRLPPLTLLSYCQHIEKKQGRIRRKKWGARTLDIDLLMYGSHIINTDKLNIPHPRLMQRDFMLNPLLSLDQNAQLPDGSFISDHYQPHCFCHQ